MKRDDREANRKMLLEKSLQQDTEIAQLSAERDALLAACERRIEEWHADNRNFTRREPESLTMMRAAIAKARKEG